MMHIPISLMIKLNTYPNFTTLGNAVAHRWLNLIASTLTNHPCCFALAGGATPTPLYQQFDTLLAATQPRPNPIQLIATDERWVTDADPQSNEGLLRRCLMQSASHWHLTSLKNQQANPSDAMKDIDARLQKKFTHPFNAVILGMGVDGHIASLFPDTPDLLQPNATSSCVATLHPQTQQARISLSFSRLLNTHSIWIVITGEKKRAVLEQAQTENNLVIPISALLTAARCEVEAFWCL